MGAALVIHGRNPEVGERVRSEIAATTGNDRIELLIADLSSQRQIRDMAAEFRSRHDELHVLVNNAGGIFGKYEITEDGVEMTFAVNHIAYFLLTDLLRDLLERSAPSRIVSVTSSAHKPGRIDFDDINFEKGYRSFPAYAASKLANIMFTYKLARDLEGTGVTANCAHPGFVSTRFGESGTPLFSRLTRMADFVRISPEKGARTSIHLATSPDVEGVTGKYFARCREARSSPRSYDTAAQDRLWDVSLDMISRSV
jgi:NAD(P)-dependent dehydrogenase (short-subunit alcohol dehydrogenase family)